MWLLTTALIIFNFVFFFLLGRTHPVFNVSYLKLFKSYKKKIKGTSLMAGEIKFSARRKSEEIVSPKKEASKKNEFLKKELRIFSLLITQKLINTYHTY